MQFCEARFTIVVTEYVLFGSPKYSEFHGTAPTEETVGKAQVYNMHNIFKIQVNLHRHFKITLSLINVSELNFVYAFCLNIHAGFVIGRSLCKTEIKSQILANVGNLLKTFAPLALRFNSFINVTLKYDHAGMNRDHDHLFLYNPENPTNCSQ